MDAATAKNKDDEERTNAIGLARYAYEYLEAAIFVIKGKVSEQQSGPLFIAPVPAYFLGLHSIELSLKAYLRHCGVTIRELRSKKYGHDIQACYRKAKELGLCAHFKMSPDDEGTMVMLIDMNTDHALRYIRIGFRRFPPWEKVEQFAKRLQQAVALNVGFRKTFNGTL